jgi:phosphoesterase RecJ-like protein
MLTREEMAHLIKAIDGKILITTHKNPDGDAVGSSLGWFNFLKKLGKNVKIIYRDRVPFFFDFLPNVEKIETKDSIEESFDWAIVTDVSELKRTGFEKIPAKKIIVIDHHITAEPFTELSIVEPEISSTCELSYHIMKLVNEPAIDLSVALPLYTGILTDTGGFNYSNTSPETHTVASELIKKGVKPYLVYSSIFERNRINRLRLLEKVLGTLSFYLNGKVATITLFRKFLEETGAYPEESEGFINYPRSIEGVEVAVFFKELDGETWKISMRSKGKVNVAKIAKELGGGGHVMAAGYEKKGDLDKIKNELLKKIALSLEDVYFNSLSQNGNPKEM